MSVNNEVIDMLDDVFDKIETAVRGNGGHYGDNEKKGAEAIDVIRKQGILKGFAKGNMIKYATRLGNKDDELKEILKIFHYALFYLVALKDEKPDTIIE